MTVCNTTQRFFRPYEETIIKNPFYRIDVFANAVLPGNPAGICLLDEWLRYDVLQSIAAENNLPETTFLIRCYNCYDLRWVTPQVEIDLCGYATPVPGSICYSR